MTKDAIALVERDDTEEQGEIAPVFDTTTPAFGMVTRFTQADWPRYGNWLVKRMMLRWPHLSKAAIPSILTGFMSANDYCMVKTHMTVTLARLETRHFEKPIVRVIFTFANGKETWREVTAATRVVESWGLKLGAVKFFPDMESDVTPGQMKAQILAKEDRVLYRDLVK